MSTESQVQDPFIQRWYIWHANRIDVLTSPHGYLSPVSIIWLSDGDQKTAEYFPGTWSVSGSTITYAPEVGKTVTNSGREIHAPVSFTARFNGEEDLAVFDYGRIRAEVKSQPDAIHADAKRFWVRIKDPESRLRQGFTGIPHFELSRGWVFPASFEPYESTRISTQNTVAKSVLQVLPTIGIVTFSYDGKDHSLEVVDVHGTPTVFFADATSGHETYGTGRILEFGRADAKRIHKIDFNRAYNFPCSFTPYCTCPIPKPENRLPFAVRAGEKCT